VNGTEDGAEWIRRRLKCISCGAARCEYQESGSALVCGMCGRCYPVREGIIDFTSASSHTDLDNIDYDSMYNTDIAQSFGYFDGLKNRISPALDSHYPCVVEVGSGTGYLSVPMVKGLSYDGLVFTDVSLKMLRKCSEKIRTYYSSSTGDRRLSYVAMDGNDFGFGPASIDLTIGHGVLHHILDWKGFMRSLRESLTDGGVAAFVEPNYKFHVALYLMFNSIMGKLKDLPNSLGPDADNLIRFYQHLHSSWKLRNEPDFVRQLEDKHMFSRRATIESLKECGFKAVEVLPAYGRELLSDKMAGYLNEMKIGPANQRMVLNYIRSQQAIFEDALDGECYASADIYVFERNPRCTTKLVKRSNNGNSAARILENEMPVETREFKLTIDRIKPEANGNGVRLIGWVASVVPIKKVVALGADGSATGFVVQARPDVLLSLRDNVAYPTENLLFSGFETTSFPEPKERSILLDVVFLDDKRSQIMATLPGQEVPESLTSKVVRSLREDGLRATGAKILRRMKRLIAGGIILPSLH